MEAFQLSLQESGTALWTRQIHRHNRTMKKTLYGQFCFARSKVESAHITESAKQNTNAVTFSDYLVACIATHSLTAEGM